MSNDGAVIDAESGLALGLINCPVEHIPAGICAVNEVDLLLKRSLFVLSGVNYVAVNRNDFLVPTDEGIYLIFGIIVETLGGSFGGGISTPVKLYRFAGIYTVSKYDVIKLCRAGEYCGIGSIAGSCYDLLVPTDEGVGLAVSLVILNCRSCGNKTLLAGYGSGFALNDEVNGVGLNKKVLNKCTLDERTLSKSSIDRTAAECEDHDKNHNHRKK